MSAITHMSDHIPECCWKSLLLNISNQTLVVYKFTAVSIMYSVLVLS